MKPHLAGAHNMHMRAMPIVYCPQHHKQKPWRYCKQKFNLCWIWSRISFTVLTRRIMPPLCHSLSQQQGMPQWVKLQRVESVACEKTLSSCKQVPVRLRAIGWDDSFTDPKLSKGNGEGFLKLKEGGRGCSGQVHFRNKTCIFLPYLMGMYIWGGME